MSELQRRYELEIAGRGLEILAEPGLDLSRFERRALRYARRDAETTHRIELRTDESLVETMAERHRCDVSIDGALLRVTTNALRIATNYSSGVTRAWLPAVGDQFENVLRILLSRLLLQEGDGILHAAALRFGNAAVAFPGVSGAGKSTLAMRHPPEDRLAEDLVAVCHRNGALWLEALPFLAFQGLDLGPCRAPLACIAFPKHGGGAAVRRLGRSETIPALSRALVCFAPAGIEAAMLDFVVRTATSVAAFELIIDKTSPFAHLLLRDGGTGKPA